MVTSALYRLMPPRKRSGSDIGEALDAAHVTPSELREALGADRGTAQAPAGDDGACWPGPRAPRLRRAARIAGRALARVDVWILIVAIASAVIAYLTLVKH
jgi:hypothetical protein